MNIPRARRYPRRPIVKAQPKFSDRVKFKIDPTRASQWIEFGALTGMEIAKHYAATYGKRGPQATGGIVTRHPMVTFDFITNKVTEEAE